MNFLFDMETNQIKNVVENNLQKYSNRPGNLIRSFNHLLYKIVNKKCIKPHFHLKKNKKSGLQEKKAVEQRILFTAMK